MAYAPAKLIRKTLQDWWFHDPLSKSAAAAFYALFSLPGFLITIVAMAALLFEREQVETQILSHIKEVLGPQVAKSMHNIIVSTQQNERDFWGVLVGGLTLFFGATGLFVQLQKTLNEIWEVEVKRTADVKVFFKERITALGIMISLGFLFLISLSLTAFLAAASDWLAHHFSGQLVFLFHFLNILVSFATVSFIFTLILKILPDVDLHWKDSLRGGVISAFLFTIGEYGLSSYFQLAEPQSSFGAAGSIILFLIWVFYSCLILLLGAEFTRTYMNSVKQSKPAPTKIAKPHSQDKANSLPEIFL